ncbi:uncharacterized protein Tco025E_01930 [Trypanosoma conorhini]|uniref:Uncharacterized protein n=1 Tax=Trypanosoma conorhini TaxID=83891 RepID=A0A422Q793_9TRYP|nr:uncharacterized protein Tco025E_01930 [Trypanosoma conorhini]RNF25830.1 hypothetical protein Tco025E_01930 [Trypanosoma conorhini]
MARAADIDRLVDHYLGLPAAPTQRPMPPADRSGAGPQPRRTSGATGPRFASEEALACDARGGYDEEEEVDIEALVESVLRGEPDSADAAALRRRRSGEGTKRKSNSRR